MICGPFRGIASSPLDAALRSPPRSAALDHRRRFFWPPKSIVQQPASMCRQSVTRDVTAFVGVLPWHTWQTLRVYFFVSVGTFFRIINSEEYITLRARNRTYQSSWWVILGPPYNYDCHAHNCVLTPSTAFFGATSSCKVTHEGCPDHLQLEAKNRRYRKVS